MLPVGITAKAVQLCAVGLGSVDSTAPAPYAITVHAGATLARQPVNRLDAGATVRDLITLGAEFEAGPLSIHGRDFATYGVTPATVFDACALAHVETNDQPAPPPSAPTISGVAALVRRAFDARITGTTRPMNAAYGAHYSWHKVGQAIDFVPAAGVGSINRDQIRTRMAASGVHLVELLGPGDRGHATHWHIAFARPGQMLDQIRPVEGDEDWIVTVARADAPYPPALIAAASDAAPAAPAVPILGSAEKAPPAWDVFAAAQWHADHGGGS